MKFCLFEEGLLKITLKETHFCSPLMISCLRLQLSKLHVSSFLPECCFVLVNVL